MASSIEELSAGDVQNAKKGLKCRRGLLTGSDDADGSASATVLHIEKKNHSPGENRVERIKITLQAASTPAMQTKSASN